MDVGHLYSDTFYGNLTTALDVKEKMRMKEINAREDRSFQRWTNIFQRGKVVCEKNNTWEKYQMYHTLQTIWERTPRLEKSLEQEGIESLQTTLIKPGNTVRNVPQQVSHQSSQVKEMGNTRAQVERRQARYREAKQCRGTNKLLETDMSLCRHHVPADFMRRNQHVVRALVRLHKHRERRRREHEKLKDELIKLSKPVIYKARVILRGHPDFDSNQYLDELESYLRHGNNYTISDDQGSPSRAASINSPTIENTNVQALGECKQPVLSPVFEHADREMAAQEGSIFIEESVDGNNNNTNVVRSDQDDDRNTVDTPKDLVNAEHEPEQRKAEDRLSLMFSGSHVYTPADVFFPMKYTPLPKIGPIKSFPRQNHSDAHENCLFSGTIKKRTSRIFNSLSIKSKKCLPAMMSQDCSNKTAVVSNRKDLGI